MTKVQVIVSYLPAESKLYVVVCCCFVTYLGRVVQKQVNANLG